MRRTAGSSVLAAIGAAALFLQGCGNAAPTSTTTATSTSTTAAPSSTPPPEKPPSGPLPYPLPDEPAASPIGLEVVAGALMAVMWHSSTGQSTDGVIDTYKLHDGSWVQVGSSLNSTGLKSYTFTFDEQLYAVLGKEVLAFDGKAWAPAPQLARMVGARAAKLGDKLYAVGVNGTWGGEGGVESFDGASWSVEPSAPLLRKRAAVTVYQEKIYVVGGCEARGDPDDCTASSAFPELQNVFVFDGATWTSAASLPNGNMQEGWMGADPRVAVLNDKLYAMGGWAGSDTDDFRVGVQMFDGAEWRTAPALPMSDTFPEVATWNGSIVLLAESYAYGASKRSALVFDGEAWTCDACGQSAMV